VRLLGSHLGHPNRKLVLKNKDRNNDDKDEAGEKSLHNLSQVLSDYRCFLRYVKGESLQMCVINVMFTQRTRRMNHKVLFNQRIQS
jgi:hypothetical protein